MKPYYLKDVLFMQKEKALIVENDKSDRIGYIKMIDMDNCEERHSFSFTTDKDHTVMMGIKKRNITNFFVATYLIRTKKKDYILKDRVGNNFLYFCVNGNINNQSIRIEENWSGNIEIKVDNLHIATLKTNEFSIKTTILIKNDIDEKSILFAVTILMYFMYKIYKNESELIENLLFD